MNDTLTTSALRPGVTLNNGNYTIVDKIGQGGFGITYRAVQNNLNRTVCIKEYFISGRCMRSTQTNNIGCPDEEGALYEKYRKGFVKEAETVASLSHPNVVEIINIFSENNTSYMVMPFIEGRSLESIVKHQGPLSFAEAMNYLAQIAEAVEYVHSRHILHRDIKPSNIMITLEHRAILIDFGSAREFIDDATQAHTSILTHGYAPPEQYSKVSRKGAYSDVYSLGATFYYALTGRDPVDSAARVTEFMPEPRSLNPSVPEHVNRAIMRAMDLNPANRPQSVRDFVAELNGAPATPSVNTPPTTPYNNNGPTVATPFTGNSSHTVPYAEGNSKNTKTLMWILLGGGAVILALIIALLATRNGGASTDDTVSVYNEVKKEEPVKPAPPMRPSDEAVRNTIKRFVQAYCNDDLYTIEQVYAPRVERFHNAYDVSRDFVVNDSRNYNKDNKVNSKRSDVQWESMVINDIGNGRVSVTYLEDYYLNRQEYNKPTYFLLRKHIILNSDCQIVSIYDDQLRKERR